MGDRLPHRLRDRVRACLSQKAHRLRYEQRIPLRAGVQNGRQRRIRVNRSEKGGNVSLSQAAQSTYTRGPLPRDFRDELAKRIVRSRVGVAECSDYDDTRRRNFAREETKKEE
jgi:hypothetical protein